MEKHLKAKFNSGLVMWPSMSINNIPIKGKTKF